ncbi:hypothetical protein ACFY4C_05050 [Actinomadura viridis]
MRDDDVEPFGGGARVPRPGASGVAAARPDDGVPLVTCRRPAR